ncbi:recombinase family protein [Wolbachia endosymbiont (group B) of Pandemis cinnamomeana]|uniref:recombinase family protein n=1 Tax=Wolbachia endosymbiont (group B) of Pandemis cinnamomeana TaxID=2954038 RepID=UPI00248C7C82|nr:recombinase family protein [Wolbachia endosymbiont (group B) of Pandemis cinnamomeana]
MTTVSLYARVSSRQQAQENTIESQIVELERRISSDGHELLDEHRFVDNGYSGSNLERPGLENLRDRVAEGKIDKIYIHSPDRLSRKFSYQMILLEEFKKAGSEIVFLNHKFDDNPDSHLFLQIQGAIAEYERAKIMERNRRGKLHAAKAGCISVMGRAPYGYRYIAKHVGEGSAQFEVDEEEANIVRKIFSRVGQERASIGEVVHELNKIPVITRTGKRYWKRSTIWNMLKNPAYIGQAAYGKTKTCSKPQVKKSKKGTCGKLKSGRFNSDKENWTYIPVPKIINENLFDSVQTQLAENRQRARVRQRRETYLLQGLMVCQRCQYTYCGTNHVHKKSTYYYYRCSGTNSSKFNGNKICDNKSIRTDILDGVIWEEVKSILKEPDRIANEYQRRLSENKKPLHNQTREKQESKLRLSIKKFIDSYAKGFISQEEFEPRITTMKQHLKEIEEEKERTLDQKKLQQELSLVTDSLKNFSSSVESKLDQVDWQTKQNIIRMLIHQIEINHNHLYIVFRIKSLANFDQNSHNRIMQCCTSSQYCWTAG